MLSNTIIQEQPVKKPRKPRTKKADMIKKKEEMEKNKAEQVPKKRGRKPKGGKIVKTVTNNIEPMMEEKNIILHLKCNLSDLTNNDSSIINKSEHYSPNIINYEPYNEDVKYTFINENINDTKQYEEKNNYFLINY